MKNRKVWISPSAMHTQFSLTAHRARSACARYNRLALGHAVFSRVLFFYFMEWPWEMPPLVIDGDFTVPASSFLFSSLKSVCRSLPSSPSTLPCYLPAFPHFCILFSFFLSLMTLKPKAIFHLASEKSLQVFLLECVAISFFIKCHWFSIDGIHLHGNAIFVMHLLRETRPAFISLSRGSSHVFTKLFADAHGIY